MPEDALITPNMLLKKDNYDIFELILFAATVGTVTRAPTSNVPTTLIPIAAIADTRKSYGRFTRITLIPFDTASSSEMRLKTTVP